MVESRESIVAMTADVVSAYISNNPVPMSELPSLIEQVHRSMESLREGPKPAEEEKKAPAVPVKRSVTHDHIVCLEDGKKYKSLKRHLATSHGLTPEEYREKWGLPRDYPIVAPGYAEARSQLAKSMGLGRKPESRKAKASKAAQAPAVPVKKTARGKAAK